MRYEKDFNIRMSVDMFRAVDADARARQLTISAYCREALLAKLKRSGVRIRPLTKQTSNNKTAEAA